MKDKNLRSYVILGVCLFLSLCMPDKGTNVLRSGFVAFSMPIFQSVRWMAYAPGALDDLSQKIQLENLALQSQIDRLYTWLKQEEHLERIAEEDRFTDKRVEVVKKNLLQQSQFLPAKVVFREPASWSSFVWIDVGSVDNEKMGFELIAENSPVITGSCLIGLVEYVGKKRSKVRLITDSSLTPSICGAQSGLQKQLILEHIDPLLRILPLQKELFKDEESCEELLQSLSRASKELSDGQMSVAKGFVEGKSHPLWRLGNQTLKGVGFVEEKKSKFKIGDVIITSGLDGIFPTGLQIGVVSKMLPTGPSEPTYTFEAQLAASQIDDLTTVQVIPPCR